jgi:hypothetical protein
MQKIRDSPVVIVLDAHDTDHLFGTRHSFESRRRLQACENDICESAVTTALTRDAYSVVIVCDVRQLSFGQRLRAIRLIRDCARRIRYECSVNGLDGLVTSYAVIDNDDDVGRIANAVETGGLARRAA